MAREDEGVRRLETRIREDIKRGTFWRRVLSTEEGNESHVEKHIGKSAVELLDRGFTDPKVKRPDGSFSVSSFDGEEAAFAQIEECLFSMIDQDQDFFGVLLDSAPGKQMALRACLDPNNHAGTFDAMQRSVVKDPQGHLQEVETNMVRIVFQRNAKMPYGFHIVTAFPDPGLQQDIPIAGRAGSSKLIVRQTRRDLAADVKKTPTFRKASPLERLCLGLAARSIPRAVRRVRFWPEAERRAESIEVSLLSPEGRDSCYSARLTGSASVTVEKKHLSRDAAGHETLTTVSCDLDDLPRRRASLSNPTCRERLRCLNPDGMRYLELVEKTARATSGAGTGKTRTQPAARKERGLVSNKADQMFEKAMQADRTRNGGPVETVKKQSPPDLAKARKDPDL